MKKIMSVLLALVMIVELGFVGGTEAYAKGNSKKGAMLKNIYFEYPKNPVAGKTAGELSDVTITSDPAGAFSATFIAELEKQLEELKKAKEYSAWMVSNDGKKYTVMKPDEKFENGKYYGYNPNIVVVVVYSIVLDFKATCNTKVVAGYNDDAAIYINGCFMDEDLVFSTVPLGKLEEGKVFDNSDLFTNVAEVGSTITDGKYVYKVKTKAAYNKVGEVEVVKAKKKFKTMDIAETVKFGGINYSVNSIGANAFKNNKKLRKVTINSYIKTIGAKSFYGCKKLTKVVIKSDVLTKIGKKAFATKGKKIKFTISSDNKKAYKKLIRKSGLKKFSI